MDELAKVYKEKFPGISDEGAQVQALLNRFARNLPLDWQATPIGTDSFFINKKNED